MAAKKDDPVEWQYKHWLNGRTYTTRTKTGVFIRKDHKGRAVVRFDGNKSTSTVPLHELNFK